jgi:CRP-like cAMP-binding protein
MDDRQQQAEAQREAQREAQSAPQREERAPAPFRREGAADAHGAEHNRLLRMLPLEDYEWLISQFSVRRLHLGDVLIAPDEPIRDAYFIRDGVASMIADEQEGGTIEVGTIGAEGFVGIPLVLGSDRLPHRVIVQVEGDAWRLSADALRRGVEERPALRRLLLKYAQFYSEHLAQSVACNRLHTVEERCARWLLMTHDRMRGDTFELTHEYLSYMLGVRRAGVTVAMGVLQSAGIVHYLRRRISIRDRPRLEEASCACYHIVNAMYQRLFD